MGRSYIPRGYGFESIRATFAEMLEPPVQTSIVNMRNCFCGFGHDPPDIPVSGPVPGTTPYYPTCKYGAPGRYKATWKREFELPWRKAGLLIAMIKWTRTSRLAIKISLSLLQHSRLAGGCLKPGIFFPHGCRVRSRDARPRSVRGDLPVPNRR